LDSPPQTLPHQLRRSGPHPSSSHRFRQPIESNRHERTRHRLAKLPQMPDAGNPPPLIVGDDSYETQLLSHGTFDIGDVESERPIPGKQNNRPLGKRQPRGHGDGDSPAHHAAAPASQPVAGIAVVTQQMMRPLSDSPAIH